MQALKRRLITIAVAIVATLTIGTIGFVTIEGYEVFDALYMSLITITTVGYEEVHRLSRAGRIFNTFLLLFGVGVMFYAIGVMTQTIIELELSEFFGKRRIRRMIDKLNNHFIVCGYGRVGRSAAQQLQRANEPFVVVDLDPARIELATKRGILAITADAKSDETLMELGIAQARGLIAALKSDADNLFVILSARALNPKLRISSRANEKEAEAKLSTAGADAVSRPYDITGYRLAQSILRPYVAEFLDLTSSDVDLGHADIEIEQMRVAKGAELSGLSLKDMQLRRDMDVIVLAVRRGDGQMRFNPPADAVIDGGDDLVVIGSPGDLQKLERRMKGRSG